MHIFASLSNHMRKQNCHIYFILVNDLAITLLISSRVSIYRVCFEHFYHKVIQSVIHSLNTIFKVQKPVHVICLFSSLMSSSKSAKSLEETIVPWQPCVSCCVVQKKCFYQKCHKNFFMNPSKFCALVSVHSQNHHWHCLNISLKTLTGLNIWKC